MRKRRSKGRKMNEKRMQDSRKKMKENYMQMYEYIDEWKVQKESGVNENRTENKEEWIRQICYYDHVYIYYCLFCRIKKWRLRNEVKKSETKEKKISIPNRNWKEIIIYICIAKVR